VALANAAGLRVAREQVTWQHDVHRPVDSRSRLLVPRMLVGGARRRCLSVGRPERAVCSQLYGDLDDLAAERVGLSRWPVVNPGVRVAGPGDPAWRRVLRANAVTGHKVDCVKGMAMMTQTTMTKGTATAAFGVLDWTAYT